MDVMPLMQVHWFGRINGCSPQRQGERRLEAGAKIKTRQPIKQNSESVNQPWRLQCLRCKSVGSTPAAVGGVHVLDGNENPTVFIRERVEKLVLNQRALLADLELKKERPMDLTLAQFHGDYVPKPDLLKVAYDHCREIFVKDKDPFVFGTLLLKPEKRNAFWALWAWARRLDELVDGMNGISHTTNDVLDRWEQRTLDAFQGRPRDIYDVALSDTVSKFPLDFQLFKDGIEGARSDITKNRFLNFNELYLYNYYVGSTHLLLLAQVMGISPESEALLETVYHHMINLGVGFALIDQLRDVGTDARMGRIYLPQDELSAAGLSEDDVFRGKVTSRWRKFMKGQIERARALIDEGSVVIPEMNADGRWAYWAFTLVPKQVLDVIEANDYETFTRKTCVGRPKMLLNLFLAYAKSIGLF